MPSSAGQAENRTETPQIDTPADNTPRLAPANIEAALGQAIEESRLSSPRTYPLEGFYASSLGQCPRKQVAERLGLPPTNPPDRRSQFKMWTGTVLGHAIQEHLERVGFLDPAWHEKRLTYRNYVGKVDGYAPRLVAVVEIKTSDDDSITRYPEMPEHYLVQGLWYCLATEISNLLVLQVGKNQGLMRHRGYVLTKEWRVKLEAEMDMMASWWAEWERSGTLPEHSHRFGWEDKLCPYLGDGIREYAEEVRHESSPKPE